MTPLVARMAKLAEALDPTEPGLAKKQLAAFEKYVATLEKARKEIARAADAIPDSGGDECSQSLRDYFNAIHSWHADNPFDSDLRYRADGLVKQLKWNAAGKPPRKRGPPTRSDPLGLKTGHDPYAGGRDD